VPILYCGVQVGEDGRVVVFGRDLRALSALQQRLVDAQQSMERDYARLRHVETRYRLLFELSSEAVLVLDAATQKVADANPAARHLFGDAAKGVLGRAFLDIFEPESAPAVQGLLSLVRSAGRGDDVRARLLEGGREVIVSASLFRQEAASLLLVRLPAVATSLAITGEEPKIKTKLLQVVESAPDGFVVTNPDGRILTANAAFLDMAQLPSEEQARGEPLERWLGRPGVDLDVLIANLRQRGTIRLFATTLRGEYGETSEVEISGVSVVNGGQPCLGFAIRNIDRRLSPAPATAREMPRSVEQLTELIGRVSLKDLVREATDMIERLCIESALELTGDNRASAAEMLGLSRQSLYVKLRRYGLGDLAEESRN
jgi:transcriptional regulator PpsR